MRQIIASVFFYKKIKKNYIFGVFLAYNLLRLEISFFN